MKKLDVLSYLLVLLAVVAGANFVANRASFFGVSQTVEAIKNKVSAKEIGIRSVGYLEHFDVTCAAAATKVEPAGGAATSIACKCGAAVSWGASDVTTGGYESDDWGANVRYAYCAGADTSCKCVAQVSSHR